MYEDQLSGHQCKFRVVGFHFGYEGSFSYQRDQLEVHPVHLKGVTVKLYQEFYFASILLPGFVKATELYYIIYEPIVTVECQTFHHVTISVCIILSYLV